MRIKTVLKIDLKIINSHYYTPVCSRRGAGYVPFLRFVLIVFLLLGVEAVRAEETSAPVFPAADASSFFYISESAVIVGKENMFVKQASSSYIYIAENAVIVGKENMFVRQQASLQASVVKKQNSESKNRHHASPVEKPAAEEKPANILFALPFSAANLSFSACDGASAVIVPQHRLSNSQATNKLNRENQYLQLEKSDFPLFFSELRQKFSPAATQCGMLISFGPNSPSLS